MAITITALHVTKKVTDFELFADLVSALQHNGSVLHDQDVVVVSSKYAALSEGRTVIETDVNVSREAQVMARNLKMRKGLAETVLRESDSVMGGVAGFAMAVTDGILAPNAGIDSSNAQTGEIILYPDDSHRVAEQIRRKVFLKFGARIGVIIADSRLMPMRAGTCGVAIASAGLVPVHDQRGETDINGRRLVVTRRAVADSIATMANHEMGEGSESTPFAIVRGARPQLTDSPLSSSDASVSIDECVYARSMRQN